MNKINIRGDINNKNIIVKENSSIYFDKVVGEICFDVCDVSNLFIYLDSSDVDFTFNISSNFTLNIFSIDSSLNVDLDLDKEGISLNYAYSTINLGDNNYKININHNNVSQTSNIVNHGINILNNKLSFIVNAIVPRESVDIVTNQDSKILLVSDKGGYIEPNLLIDNDKIEANHSSFIGDFKPHELFYLESRGLSSLESKKLLAKSFLLGNMKDITFREINLIKEKLNMYWR